MNRHRRSALLTTLLVALPACGAPPTRPGDDPAGAEAAGLTTGAEHAAHREDRREVPIPLARAVERRFAAAGAPRAAIVWAETEYLELCAAWAYDDYELQTCASLSPYPWVATELPNAIVSGGVAMFDPSTVTAPAGDFNFGFFVLYDDRDGDGVLDLLAPGTAAAVDGVLASSLPLEPTSDAFDFIVSRVSPGSSPSAQPAAWRAFNAAAGCADPGPGISVLRFGADSSCTVAPASGGVLAWTATRDDDDLLCRFSALDSYGYPSAPPPAGTDTVCIDDYLLVYDAAPGALCADHQRLDLYGCSNVTSQAACYASSWDLSQSPPSWWPCGVDPVLEDVAVAHASPAPTDALLGVFYASGPHTYSLSALSAEVETLGGYAGAVLDLDDADGDGAFSAGDTLWIREHDIDRMGGQDLFDAQSEPGRYRVTLSERQWDGYLMTLRTGWYEPVALPALPEPATFELTSGPTLPADPTQDPFVVLTCADGCNAIDPSRVSVDLLDYWAYISINGCIDTTWNAYCDPTALTHVDADGDGTLSNGDQLLLWLGEIPEWWSAPNTFGYGTINVTYAGGRNYSANLGSISYEPQAPTP